MDTNKMEAIMLTQEELKANLSYDPLTGLFTWLKSSNQHTQKGMLAGTPTTKGYINIWVKQRSYKAHRLAYLYMTGDFPKDLIDHKDGVRDNNSWGNLQDIDNSGNLLKAKIYKSNTTGHKGVSHQGIYFRVRKTVDGKRISLGLFKDLDDARRAYDRCN